MKKLFLMAFVMGLSVGTIDALTNVTVKNQSEGPLEASYHYTSSANDKVDETAKIAGRERVTKPFTHAKKFGKGRPAADLKVVELTQGTHHAIMDVKEYVQGKQAAYEELMIEVNPGFRYEVKALKSSSAVAPAVAQPESPRRRARSGSSGDVKQAKADQMNEAQLRERITALEGKLADCERKLAALHEHSTLWD